MKKKSEVSKREIIVNQLKLPKDTLLGASIVTITGNCEAMIENYRGILEYTDCRIVLQGKNIKIEICGKRLKVLYYTNEDMKICGRIEAIHYI